MFNGIVEGFFVDFEEVGITGIAGIGVTLFEIDIFSAVLLDFLSFLRFLRSLVLFLFFDESQVYKFWKRRNLIKKNLHVRESNPGLASDSRGYSPLY